jgi:hypothetical protein
MIITRLLILVIAAGLAHGQQKPMALTGGGEVTLTRTGEFLDVAVKGPRAGLASLCVGDDSRVRILHASAAVGEASYEKDGDRWILKSGFEWKLRDTRTGPPGQEQVEVFLASAGWTANASRTGDPRRNFRIRLTDRARYLGVTFFTTDEPGALSYWPGTIDDDCRAVKVAQGYLPETARFDPRGWHPIN